MFNGTNLAAGSSLLLPNPQIDDDGDYTLVVTNTFGSVTLHVTLSVLSRPVIFEHPQSVVVAVGTPASFRISTRANPSPVTFRWRRSNAAVSNSFISGPISSAFTSVYFTNAISNAFYAAVVSNIVGTALGGGPTGLSSNGYMTVMVPPTNQSVEVGSTATFSTSQRGQYPVRYQWQFNNANLTDATNATLALSNVQPAQAGSYGVVVIMTTNQVSGGVTTFLSATGTFTATLQVTIPSPRLTSPQYSNGSFQMILQVISNQTYAVEISSSLTNWTTLRSFTATNNSQPFSETTNAVQRFYRARVVQPP
jgi:hypothetical protein